MQTFVLSGSGFGSFLFAIPNLNSILNVFIYAGGQPEVRYIET